MPTYVYRRADGSTFEIQQRITEDPLTQCPETGQSIVRVISANTGLIFKGSGFYLTDYARNAKGKADASSTPSESPTKPASDSASTKPDSSTSDKKAAA